MNTELQVINNEYQYKNILPTKEAIDYLVNYLDSIFKSFTSICDDEEEKNKKLKEEYREYNYKRYYATTYKIYIAEKTYHNIECNTYEEFKSAEDDNNLKNIDHLEIKLDLSYRRGKGNNLEECTNEFIIIFKPFDTKFARKSNHKDENMNNTEQSILDILDKFPKLDTIFGTGE